MAVMEVYMITEKLIGLRYDSRTIMEGFTNWHFVLKNKIIMMERPILRGIQNWNYTKELATTETLFVMILDD